MDFKLQISLVNVNPGQLEDAERQRADTHWSGEGGDQSWHDLGPVVTR